MPDKKMIKSADASLRDLVKIYESRDEGVFIHDWNTFSIIAVNSAGLEMHACRTLDELDHVYASLPSPYSRIEAHDWLEKAKNSGAQKFEWRTRAATGKIIPYTVLIDKLEFLGKPFLIVMAQLRKLDMKDTEEELLDAVQISQNASEFSSLLFSQLTDKKSFFQIIKAECHRLGELFRADHVFCEIFDGHLSFPGTRMQWPDDRCVLGNMFFLDDPVSIVRKQLSTGIPFVLESPELLPYEATAEKDYYIENKVKSAALVPIMIRNQLCGVLGIEFNHKNHLWKQIEIGDLRTLGNILTSALIALEKDMEIRSSEARYQSIVQSMNEGIVVHGLDTKIIECNDSACKILGISASELKQLSSVDWHGKTIHPDGTPFLVEDHPVALSMRTGQSFQNVTMGLLDEKGTPATWISINTAPLYSDKSNEITGSIATFTDITKKIESDKKLRSFESFITHSNDGVLITKADPENPVIVYANRAMTKISGYSSEELVGQTPRILQGPKTDPEKRSQIRQALEKGSAIHTELINYTKQGIEYHSEINLFPIPGLDGRPEQFAAIQRDITSEIRIQEELDRTNELLRLTIEGANIGTWVYDLATGKTVYNDEWCKMLGLDPRDTRQNASTWESRIHPQDRDRVLRIQNEYISGKRGFQEFEHRLRHKNGNWVWVLSRGRIIERAPDGSPLILAGTHIDITRQKLDSEKLLLAIEASNLGSWEWDMVNNLYVADEYCAIMLGMNPAEFGNTIDSWQSWVHPDDVTRVWQEVSKYLRGETPLYSAEYRMKHKNGHWIWVADRGKVVERNSRGEPVRSMGTQIDITKMKEAEQAVRQNEETLSLAVEAGKIGVWDWDLLTDACSFSSQFKSILGDAGAELPEMMNSFYELIHPEDRILFARQLEEHLTSHKNLRMELRIKNRGNEYIWCVCRAQSTSDMNGKPVRIVGTLIDVTQRKKAEDILAREAQLTALRYQINPHFLFNTLNSIRAYIPTDNQEARTMISHLSEYLRYSLREGNKSFVSLRQEIESLKHYLDIEKTRFNDDLVVEMHIQPDAMEYLIAPLLVQPIVENAIKYGKKTNPGQLIIKIFGWIESGFMNIEVSNTGRWMDSSETIESTHIGISNINDRLFFLYGSQVSLQVYEENGQVRVIMKIPISTSSQP